MAHLPTDIFEDANPRAPLQEADGQLVLDLDGFEGPIDVLLALARDQKVDLSRISVLALAEQFIAFVAEARRTRLELAADYLVMAAWLAYLKSRLLLPQDPGREGEPSGEDLAAALAFQLRRLEAMQTAAARLMARPQLGRDVFARGGAPEGLATRGVTVWQAGGLLEVLQAYASVHRRKHPDSLTIEGTELSSVEDAIARLSTMLGRALEWTDLKSFLPPHLAEDADSPASKLARRSGLAALFVASLELVRAGKADLLQAEPFGPLLLRRAED